jgi:hypothetical protein
VFVAALSDDDGIDTYPFSLQYLALCMSRVVRRTARDHNTLFGHDSWKISVMFYNFYKDFNRQRLLREIGALTDRVVSLPVVSKAAPPMPVALEQMLLACIASEDVPTDSVLAMFNDCESYIASLAPPFEECAVKFIDQIEAVLSSMTVSSSDGSSKFDYLGAFLEEAAYESLVSKLGLTVVNSDRAHVTLWHFKNRDAASLFPVVYDLMGQSVSVTVRTLHLLFVAPIFLRVEQVDAVFSSLDAKQIALRVSSVILTDGDEVPIANAWPHITVACDKVGLLICYLNKMLIFVPLLF